MKVLINAFEIKGFASRDSKGQKQNHPGRHDHNRPVASQYHQMKKTSLFWSSITQTRNQQKTEREEEEHQRDDGQMTSENG